MAEADARRGPHPRPVGPAMRQRVGHRADARGIDRLGRAGVEEPGDAAHLARASRALRSASTSIGPSAREELRAIAARGSRPGRASADRWTATARCGAAEQLRLQRLELHVLVARGQRCRRRDTRSRPCAPPVPGAVDAHRRCRRRAARRSSTRTQRSSSRSTPVPNADELLALALAADRPRWRGRPRCPARRCSGRTGDGRRRDNRATTARAC